jgi:hypothetical protein
MRVAWTNLGLTADVDKSLLEITAGLSFLGRLTAYRFLSGQGLRVTTGVRLVCKGKRTGLGRMEVNPETATVPEPT